MPPRSFILGLSAAALTIWNGAARASDGAEPADLPQLVTIEPMRVPIVDHGALIGRLDVRAMWQVRDSESLEDAEARLPALRAALVAAAADHARLTATPGQAVDPRPLTERLEGYARRRGFSGELLVLEASTQSG